MVDGSTHDVLAINPDLIRYEDMARQRGWGGPGDSPIRWTTYVCWAALKRQLGAELPEFDAWQIDVANIEAVDEDADPTPPVVGSI